MLCYHAEEAKDSQFCTRDYFPMWSVKEHFSPEGVNINEAWGIGRTSPDPFLLWVGSGHETTTEMSFLIDFLAHEVVDGTRSVSTKQGPPVRFTCTDISSILIVYFKSIQREEPVYMLLKPIYEMRIMYLEEAWAVGETSSHANLQYCMVATTKKSDYCFHPFLSHLCLCFPAFTSIHSFDSRAEIWYTSSWGFGGRSW